MVTRDEQKQNTSLGSVYEIISGLEQSFVNNIDCYGCDYDD